MAWYVVGKDATRNVVMVVRWGRVCAWGGVWGEGVCMGGAGEFNLQLVVKCSANV